MILPLVIVLMGTALLWLLFGPELAPSKAEHRESRNVPQSYSPLPEELRRLIAPTYWEIPR